MGGEGEGKPSPGLKGVGGFGIVLSLYTLCGLEGLGGYLYIYISWGLAGIIFCRHLKSDYEERRVLARRRGVSRVNMRLLLRELLT